MRPSNSCDLIRGSEIMIIWTVWSNYLLSNENFLRSRALSTNVSKYCCDIKKYLVILVDGVIIKVCIINIESAHDFIKQERTRLEKH